MYGTQSRLRRFSPKTLNLTQREGGRERGMKAMEMDVEEEEQFPPNRSSNSFSRLGLKNSIQTNFGEDYVFQISPKFVPLTPFLSPLPLHVPLSTIFLTWFYVCMEGMI